MSNEKYSCLVVDDEPIARKIIVGYIEQMPFLSLAGECINAISAIDQLRTSDDIDIIFLDINRPNLSGLQLLKIIQPAQPVIFTTAYTEYAIESYELNAVDYLLKPFSLERFTKAAYKAVSLIQTTQKNSTDVPVERKPDVFIKSDGKSYPVLIDDILYCEAMKNYTLVVLSSGEKLMPLTTLSRFETFLQEEGGQFVQVHRSFLVSKKHIKAVTSNTVLIEKFEIPIGIQFRERFYKAIGMKEAE